MNQVLTDAEYRQLTDIQKAQYWANRFHDMQDERDRLQERNIHLRQIIDLIKDTISRA